MGAGLQKGSQGSSTRGRPPSFLRIAACASSHACCVLHISCAVWRGALSEASTTVESGLMRLLHTFLDMKVNA